MAPGEFGSPDRDGASKTRRWPGERASRCSNRLAPTKRTIHQCEFVGHSLCKAHRIAQTVTGMGIGFEPCASGCHAQRSRMDRDEHPRSRRPVKTDEDRFALPLAEKRFHKLPP